MDVLPMIVWWVCVQANEYLSSVAVTSTGPEKEITPSLKEDNLNPLPPTGIKDPFSSVRCEPYSSDWKAALPTLRSPSPLPYPNATPIVPSACPGNGNTGNFNSWLPTFKLATNAFSSWPKWMPSHAAFGSELSILNNLKQSLGDIVM